VAGVASNVDLVTLSTSGNSTSIVSRVVVNLAYLGASTYVNLTPGAYTVALVPAGLGTPLLPSTAGLALNLTAGTITTLVATGCQVPGAGICAAAATPLQFVTLPD